MNTLPNQLPRLLYVGDVPVESSYHGSALIYRLLQSYPADRLQIVEAGLQASLPERRLKNVFYHFQQVPRTRLHNTRLTRWYYASNLLLARGRAQKLKGILEEFKPQAILTVTEGSSWITAAEVARKHGLPLHLICHDEWATSYLALPLMTNWMERIFGDNYRAAASRLCVCPFMVEDYQRRYGVEGKVLYPSRAADATVLTAPPQRLRQSKQGLVCAYAGSVSSTDYRRSLRLLAECLQPFNGKLLIFGPASAKQAEATGWWHPNMQFQGLVGSQELITRLREEADVLFVPMSFVAKDRINMEISFPSKLTDYTAVGLPLLICGPEYCSAVRWARENPGVAEVVGSTDAVQLSQAVGRLAQNPDYLMNLGLQALEAGDRFFSHRNAWRILEQGLLGLDSPSRIK